MWPQNILVWYEVDQMEESHLKYMYQASYHHQRKSIYRMGSTLRKKQEIIASLLLFS